MLGSPCPSVVRKPDERLMMTTGRCLDGLSTGEHQTPIGRDSDFGVAEI